MIARLTPLLALAALILAWELAVALLKIPPAQLPAPSLIVSTLFANAPQLFAAAATTLLEALQVTPLIAVAPLLLIYLEPRAAVLTCAALVAFFPILSNAAAGLKAADRGLVELFRLKGASPADILFRLRLPSALPSIFTGLRIGAGLALVGAVAAELAAGAAGQGEGLAFRIVEAGYRLKIPMMYAAVVLLCFCGLALYGAFAGLDRILLRRWRDGPEI